MSIQNPTYYKPWITAYYAAHKDALLRKQDTENYVISWHIACVFMDEHGLILSPSIYDMVHDNAHAMHDTMLKPLRQLRDRLKTQDWGLRDKQAIYDETLTLELKLEWQLISYIINQASVSVIDS